MTVLLLAACARPADNPFVTTTPAWVDRSAALVFDGPAPRHVLMLSIDTLRRDRFGPYSVTGVDYTPFLSSLSAGGVALTDVQQCSDWTFASTSCTLSGRYAEEDGFVPTLSHKASADENQLPDGQRTLAVRLAAAGWHTILVSANSWLGPVDNNAQGYDEFDQPPNVSANSILADGLARVTAATADGDVPWLLHLHFIEPHPPYNPPAAYLDEEALLPPLDPIIDLTTQDGHYAATDTWPDLDPAAQANLEAHLWARYDGELRYLDDQISAQWSNFAPLLADTLVVVWTDHGEQFWERGHQSHAWGLGAEENDAVLFFAGDGLRQGTWTEGAHAVDLVPTVLAAVDLPPIPGDPTLAGDVLGLGKVHRPRFASSDGRQGLEQAVTLDGWKLTFDFAGRVHLYDRNTDRYEAVDRLVAHPDDPHLAPLWDLLLPRVRALHDLLPDRSLTWPDGLRH